MHEIQTKRRRTAALLLSLPLHGLCTKLQVRATGAAAGGRDWIRAREDAPINEDEDLLFYRTF